MIKDRKLKKLVIIFSVIVAILLVILSLTTFYTKDARVEFPLGSLTSSQEQTVFELKEGIEKIYKFADIPYLIGVPSEGQKYVEGGYVYTLDGYGLIVGEISRKRTVESYLSGVLPSMYAVKEGEFEVRTDYEDEGYINGYKAIYKIASEKFRGIGKVFEVTYLIDLDERENVILTAIVPAEAKALLTSEKLKEAEDALSNLTKSLSPSSILDESDAENSEDIEETADETDVRDGDEIHTATVEADADYEMLRLSFSYMDVMQEIKTCEVNVNDVIYAPANESKPGEIVFLIPDVKKGQEIAITVEAGDLKGTCVDMIEAASHDEEYAMYSEGNLHVEESYEEVEDVLDEEEKEVMSIPVSEN